MATCYYLHVNNAAVRPRRPSLVIRLCRYRRRDDVHRFGRNERITRISLQLAAPLSSQAVPDVNLLPRVKTIKFHFCLLLGTLRGYYLDNRH